jgi:hypothetical protein
MSRIAAQNLINILEGSEPIYSVNTQSIRREYKRRHRIEN